ncbi:unnamed protein product [Urochloa humidicola]
MRPTMSRHREPRPAMPRGRGRWSRPAMPPRGRGPPRPVTRRPLTARERRLAEEVLHLHSLWRQGPPPAPTPSPEPAPTQSRSADRKTKTSDHKRRKLDGAAAAAEPKDTWPEWAPAPAPPDSSPKSWPEAAPSSSTPAKPPPTPISPGALAQQKALRAAAEFFSNRGDSSDDDEEASESEGGEQDAAGFLTGLFERDAALRGHYERGCEDGKFACMVCAAGTRKARRFRGCVALVQHAHDASSRCGSPRAHRALAAVLCRVLGWDVSRLPSIVLDPRGTLGQALTAGATAGVQLPKENGDTGGDTDSSSDDEDEEEYVETEMEDSSTDDDEEENELESSEESAEKEDVDTGMEDSRTDGDEEENELESSEESAEKENTINTYLPGSKDACKHKEHCKEAAVRKEKKCLRD